MTRRAEHNELPPKRLLDEHATPDELRDALQALRDRAPTPAAAARMREQIAKPVGPAPRAPGMLVSVALLALVSAFAWSAWPRPEPSRAPHSAAPSEAPMMPMPAAHEAPKITTARPVARTVELPAQAEPAAPQPAAEPVAAATPAPTAALDDAPAPKREREPLAPKPSTARAADSIAPTADPTPEPIAKAKPKAKPLAQSEEAERLFADPQDEAGLLYRARRLASSDPKAALRLLVLHEASFPDGAFVQERDMLEIQIHERLGQAATAKRLAALFKQRYPDSVYRVSP
jgi:hypothetical protein